MALKSTLTSEEKAAEIEEALDALDKLVDRLKVLYEQYFMGIQKQAPAHLHTDAERRLRELSQRQIRNTALRYRFATIQQKFGAYSAYWKRTLRDIEAGRYIRNLSKLRRQAQLSGEALPDEIMAAMPKRMREAIERDRAAALADAQRKHMLEADDAQAAEPDTQPEAPRVAAPPPPTSVRRGKTITTDPFLNVGEDDIAAALTGLADEALAALEQPKPAPRPVAPRLAPGAIPLPPRVAPSTIPTPPPRMAPPAIPGAAPRPPAPPPRPPAPPARAAAAPATPPPAAQPRAPSPSVSTAAGISDAETRALYAKYVKAREVVGDKSDGLSYDKLVRTLQSQGPKILEQHKASSVEWNVVIRDNKVVLKAKPK